jgi:predicted MFS family arabinose efflux permease
MRRYAARWEPPLGSWGTLSAVSFTGFVAAFVRLLQPVLISSLIDGLRWSPARAGLIASAEMAGLALAGLLMGGVGMRWRRRAVIVAGAALGVIGSVVPSVVHYYPVVLASRLVTGGGAGLILSVVMALLGASRNPERAYAINFFALFTASSLFFLPACGVVAHYGASGGYTLQAILLASVWLTVRWCPEIGTRGSEDATWRQPVPIIGAVLILSISVVFSIGDGALWAFVHRLGLNDGLSAQQIAIVLSVAQLAFIAGSVGASVLEVRLGRAAPILAAIAVTGTSAILLGRSGGAGIFAAAVVSFGFAKVFFLTYVNGWMAALDPAGRIVALGVTSQTLGLAVGPAVAGMMVEHTGYIGVTWTALAACCVATALLLTLAFVSSRSTSAGGRGPTTVGSPPAASDA